MARAKKARRKSRRSQSARYDIPRVEPHRFGISLDFEFTARNVREAQDIGRIIAREVRAAVGETASIYVGDPHRVVR